MTTSSPQANIGVVDSPGETAVAAVVVNYGSHDLLEQNLGSLGPAVDVVVVDNFHSQLERIAVGSLCERLGWTLVAMATNSGFGSAVNAGVRQASDLGATVVLLINPDASIESTDLWQLVGECVRNPRVLVGAADRSVGRDDMV